MNRLKQKYNEKIAPKLLKDFKLGNVMEVPRIRKISVNLGIGPYRENREAIESVISDLTLLTGQKPSARMARKSIAGFKVRQGDTVGYTVTLRGERMWAFLDKLINISLPRVRDFRGLKSTAFDVNGNYSIGIREHVIFPEVNPNITRGIRSLQVSIVTDSKDQEMNLVLLKELGMPFKEGEINMAKKGLLEKHKRANKFKVRVYNRCPICGSPRGFYRRFKMCRKCFRELAHKGELPGIRKASW